MKKHSILLKKTLLELSKLADDPQRSASRYRMTMWIWLVLALAGLVASIWFQEQGDPTHRDAPLALISGLCMGLAFYYRSASQQAEIIGSDESRIHMLYPLHGRSSFLGFNVLPLPW